MCIDIKVKANPISTNTYITILEIIQDLKNIFSKFDKIAKSDTLLHNPKYEIVILNSKKTYDEFLAWFTSVIALLDFTDCYKISNLWWTFNEELQFKMADGTTYAFFSQYISHCC